MGNKLTTICCRCLDVETADDLNVSSIQESKDFSSHRYQKLGSLKSYLSLDKEISDINTRMKSLIQKKPMTWNDEFMIDEALKNHFLFRRLSPEIKKTLMSKMKCFTVQPQKVLFRQGEPGNYFFVLTSGQIEIIVDNKIVSSLGEGSCFGELALITYEPRQATVKTVKDSEMWGISQSKFKKTLEHITSSSYEENKRILTELKIFRVFNHEQIERILTVINVQTWDCNEYIFKQGDYGFQFYIIKSGKAAIIVHGKKVGELESLHYFGELALFGDCKRAASIKTLEKTTLLSINKLNLQEILGDSFEKMVYRNSIKLSIRKCGCLDFLTNLQIESIIDSTVIKAYSEGDTVIAEGQAKNSTLYIVIDGFLTVNDEKVKKFSILGTKSIFKDLKSDYTSNYLAGKGCRIGLCSREDLEKMFDLNELKTNNQKIKMLKKINLIRLLPKKKLEHMAKFLKTRKFSNKSYIVKQDTPPDHLYILKKGTAKVMRNNLIVSTLSDNSYFGERSILLNENRIASVVAQGTVKCYTMNKDYFLRIIDKETKAEMVKRLSLYKTNFSLDSLVPLNILGNGIFTKVILSLNKENNALYAVKCIRKDMIAKMKNKKFPENEYNILKTIDHSMILKHVKTLEDIHFIYLVLEFVRGSSLYHVLKLKRKLSEQDTKFYVYSLVMVLEYLHKKQVIHRNLKPDNIMLDEQGYLKLIDFGSAKIVKGRTFTILGTPHYMAPEVVLGVGHSATADLWSLGVIMYELLHGALPFGNNSCDIQEVYQEILDNSLQFHDNVQLSDSARSFLKKLLNKNTSLRYPDFDQSLRDFEWLQDINQDQVYSREISAPFLPKVKKIDKHNINSKKTFHDYLNEANIKDSIVI